nr:sigma-70 family RNA polymerase sigma factor [Motilibacter aurantiacus]
MLRELAPQALGALVRRYGDFARCEDAVQEALLAAAQKWPWSGVPERPRGWLVTVASRRYLDEVRADTARARRERAHLEATPRDELVDAPADADRDGAHVDSLTLLLLCCHPALQPPSQLALALRAVGGLTTAEIARAFLVPEPTIAQRISRAKARVRESGHGFALRSRADLDARMPVVLQVLYLVFNEGYAASSGPDLHRAELTGEAIRLTRRLHAQLPTWAELQGLLALMLLTDARRAARTSPDGFLVPLPEQDRSLWDAALVAEGLELVASALSRGRPWAYQVQAAIAAVHAEAPTAEETDWKQVAALYDVLLQLAPGPAAALNRVVAVGMAEGPHAGLAQLELLEEERGAARTRLEAVRAHLLERAGDVAGAAAEYRKAASRAASVPEQRFLTRRAAELAARAGAGPG